MRARENYFILWLCLIFAKAKCSITKSMKLIDAAYSPISLAAIVDETFRDSDYLDFFRASEDCQCYTRVLYESTESYGGIDKVDVILVLASTTDVWEKLSAVLGHLSRSSPRIVKVISDRNEVAPTEFSARYKISYILPEGNPSEVVLCKVTNGQLIKICDCSELANEDACEIGPMPGGVIRATYDEWYPLFYTKKDGSGVAGMIVDMFDFITRRLNMTVVYVKNKDPGSWGIRGENGTWNGMIGMIFREEVDMSLAGVGHTLERRDVVDFSFNILEFKSVLFVRKDKDAKVNMWNYFYEFDLLTWLGIAITSFFCMITLLSVLILTRCSVDDKFEFSAAFVLRALIIRKTDTNFEYGLSFKMTMLVIFGFTIVLNVAYRAALNAFLAVVIEPKGIADMDDVYQLTDGLTMWPGGIIENALSNEDHESVESKLYRQFLGDEHATVSSYGEGLINVRKNNYALLSPEVLTITLPEYTCDIIKVKDYLYIKTFVGIPVISGAKLRHLLDRELLKMRASGTMERLTSIHFREERHDSDCFDSKVGSLGFYNALPPFNLLILGGVCAFILVLVEALVQKVRSKTSRTKKSKITSVTSSVDLKISRIRKALSADMESAALLEHIRQIITER